MSAPMERERYIDGLRVLASVLETHPKIRIPHQGSGELAAMTLGFWGDDARERLAEAARAFPCAWRKNVRDSEASGAAYFDLHGQLGSLHVTLTAYRDSVCRRVSTGTKDREVEEVVTPAVTRKVVKPVETFEWECAPVLAGLPERTPAEVTS
jgi:hypothetical protein